MKKILFICTTLFIPFLTYSQNKFRVDYDLVSIYDQSKKRWDDWKSGDNTFVININSKGDILHIKANGDKVIYKTLSEAEENWTDKERHHYQTIEAIHEDGDLFKFQIFDDAEIGLKMIYKNFMIQFAKSNN